MLSVTSLPIALTLTLSVKSLTTLKLTSASRSAILISLRAETISSSLRSPRPFSFLNIPSNFSDNASNIGHLNLTMQLDTDKHRNYMILKKKYL